MVGCDDPRREYPLPGLHMLWFECVQPVPPNESFCYNLHLQHSFRDAAEQIFKGAPDLTYVTCVERVDDLLYEVRVFRNPDGSGHLVAGVFG